VGGAKRGELTFVNNVCSIWAYMTKKYGNRITMDAKIMAGKPIIKGTRISVEFILKLLAQGIGYDEILRDYPHLKKEDIYAALEYATDTLEEEKIYPLSNFQYA